MPNSTLEEIVGVVSHGHAHDKHVLGNDPLSKNSGVNQFRTGTLGPDLKIENQADLKNYLQDFFTKEGTKGIRDGDNFVFYNKKDNVLVVFNPKDGDLGTAYRPDGFAQKWTDQVNEIRRRNPAAQIVSEPADVQRLAERYTKVVDAHPLGSKTYKTKMDQGIGLTHTVPDDPVKIATAKATSEVAAEAAQDLAALRAHQATEGFKDAATGMSYLYNKELGTFAVIDSKGVATLEKAATAEAKYMDAFADIYKKTGEMPDVIQGAAKILGKAEEGGKIAKFFAKYADDAERIAHYVGKASKVLPAVGAVAAGAELYSYYSKANTAARFGVIPEASLAEYKTIMAGNAATGAGGLITSTAGEAACLLAYKQWADKWNIPPHVRQDLQPSGLVQMGLSKMGVQTASAEQPDGNNEIMSAFGEGGAGRPGLTTFIMANPRAMNSFASAGINPADPNMPPEMQTLVDITTQIQDLTDRASMLMDSDPLRAQIQNQLDNAQKTMANIINEFDEHGGMEHVMDYVDEIQDSAPVQNFNNLIPDIKLPDVSLPDVSLPEKHGIVCRMACKI